MTSIIGDAVSLKAQVPPAAVGGAGAIAPALDVEMLFASSEEKLGRFLVQMVRDRSLAEDLLQDVFHDALRGKENLANADSPIAWLYGIARNHALQALRRERRSRKAIDLLGRRPQTDTGEGDRELVAVRDLLERHLSADDRALVVLRYLHGFDAAELAALTGRSAEAVRQRLSRARRTLIEASGGTVERYGWEER
jgi:RNA polymerase sigma-70 factor (ECF subfamily)